jgi:hypothetical protein
VLDGRVGDAGDVGFLETVLAEHGSDDLAAQQDDRHRIGKGGEQAGHRVGGSRPRGHGHDAGIAGGAGIAVRHVHGALLVAGEDQLDARLVEGVEQGDGGAAGQPEDDLDPFLLQALHHLLPARGHLAGGRRSRCLGTIVGIFS